jgi:hypothetical protein
MKNALKGFWEWLSGWHEWAVAITCAIAVLIAYIAGENGAAKWVLVLPASMITVSLSWVRDRAELRSMENVLRAIGEAESAVDTANDAG